MSSEKNDIIERIVAAAAQLSDIEYDRQRKALAKDAGMSRIGTFDAAVAAARRRLRAAQREQRREQAGARPALPLGQPLVLSAFPFVGGKDETRLDHGENVRVMLDGYGFEMYYDANLKKGVWAHPDIPSDTDNADNRLMSEIASLCALNNVPTGKLDMHLSAHYERNQRAPVAEYLAALEWDGTPRFDLFSGALNSNDPGDLLAACVRVFLLEACAAADGGKVGIAVREALGKFTEPAYEYVLVLLGAQGKGKTKRFLQLVPAALRKEYTREGVTLDLRDKDSRVNAVSAWLTELGELDATFRKSDIVAFKGFASLKVDRIRLPYARAASALRRRAVFFGTVNDPQYLRDTTGNRRFLPVTVGTLAPDIDSATLDQIWAEAWHRYTQGEQWWPTEAEERVLEAATEARRERSPIEEALAEMFDWSAGYADSTERFSVTTIVNRVIPASNRILSRQELRDGGEALRSLWRSAKGVEVRDDGKVFAEAVDVVPLRAVKAMVHQDGGRAPGWLLPPVAGNQCSGIAEALQRRTESRIEQERRAEQAAKALARTAKPGRSTRRSRPSRRVSGR